MANLRVILGSMTFGGVVNEQQSHEMMKSFLQDSRNSEIDTAILYQNGETEKIMGRFGACRDPEKAQIACKVNAFYGLTADKVVEQLNKSLKSLQIDSCHILYIHWPDSKVPIEETLKGVDKLHKDGKFKEFGLSNFSAWQVAHVYHVCKENGYVKPTVLQELYNPISRELESQLIPAARKFGMRIYVYSPLAGGMLSGKYDFSKSNEEQEPGRIFGRSDCEDALNSFAGKAQDLFWRPTLKDAVLGMQTAVKNTYGDKVSLVEATLRWLRHHSKLIDGDGIIIGCSKLNHLASNIDACRNDEPLHEDVVKAFEKGWDGIKSQAPSFELLNIN